MPGLACFIKDEPLNLIALEVRNDIILNIYVLSNKEKLRSLV